MIQWLDGLADNGCSTYYDRAVEPRFSISDPTDNGEVNGHLTVVTLTCRTSPSVPEGSRLVSIENLPGPEAISRVFGTNTGTYPPSTSEPTAATNTPPSVATPPPNPSPIGTDWSSISPDFESRFASLLPAVPTTPLSAPTWSEHYDPATGPVQVLSLGLDNADNVYCRDGSAMATEWPRDAIRAGPSATCDIRGCMCRPGAACGTYGYVVLQHRFWPSSLTLVLCIGCC